MNEKPKPRKKKMPDPLVDDGQVPGKYRASTDHDTDHDTDHVQTKKIDKTEDKNTPVFVEPITESATVLNRNDNYTVQNPDYLLKILFIIHGYIDTMGSGAERMVQTIAEFFVSRGHDVTVAVKRPGASEANGVKIVKCQTKAFEDTVKNYDVVFSHLDLSIYAMDLAKNNKKPYVWICHNTNKSAYVIIEKRPKFANVVFNSEWVKREMGYTEHNSFVLIPPCDYRKWDDGADHYDKPYITLVNHNLNKGGGLLVKLAKSMPDRQFLAVEGSYDIQIMDREVKNIKYIKQQSDMTQVYKDTRLLLMMSEYESWGLVCNEAGASGIPVLSTKTSGTWENMGEAGAFVEDRKDIEQWVKAIEMMDDKKVYAAYSEAMKRRTREQDPQVLLQQFENWIYGIRQSYNFQYGHNGTTVTASHGSGV